MEASERLSKDTPFGEGGSGVVKNLWKNARTKAEERVRKDALLGEGEPGNEQKHKKEQVVKNRRARAHES